MKKIIFFFLFFYLSLIQTKTIYDIDIIKEQVPKTLLFDAFESFPYKILKYYTLCNENSNSGTINITFQIYSETFKSINLYRYDSLSDIKREENGTFSNSTPRKIISNSIIPFNDLICDKDYYFVLSTKSSPDIFMKLYFQLYTILILDEKTNTINLSPLQSDYYSIIPRTKGFENLFYSFNEDKFAFIIFNEGIITLKEDNTIIYENKNDERSIKKSFEFKKDKKYDIYFNSLSPINIYFCNIDQYTFFKHDFDKGPIITYYSFPKNIYEIDISNFNIGEFIIFQKDENVEMEFQYQYKNDFKQNNFIDLGIYKMFNYIVIKKEKNDSLLLYLKSHHDEPSILSIYKYNITEITEDYTENFNGPKLFFIDYFTFNNFKSFGIESNHNYYFFEQHLDFPNQIVNEECNNIIITTQNSAKSYIFRRAFIVFNTTDNIDFKVTKFNFPILKQTYDERNPYSNEYFQMCQGESTLKEIYFYIGKAEYEIFTPVFGKYNAYFIKEEEIKSLSDLDFNKIAETNFVDNSDVKGFLKIACQSPTMLKHYYSEYYFIYEYLTTFSSGKKYTILNSIAMKNKFYLDDNLINKTIPLKFSLLGVKENTSIMVFINDTNYTLNNSESLEIEYTYKQKNESLIFFNIDENIENTMFIEVIVGFIKEDLDSYKQIDFYNSLGNIVLEKEKGIIIKIPEDLNKDLYDFSIIIPDEELNIYEENYYDIQILYDKKEFIVPKYDIFYNLFPKCPPNIPLIPLFKTNPYLTLSEKDKESGDKFFYILIYNNYKNKMNIYIKKPKLFSITQFNTINKLPQLKGEEEQYYYKIYFPDGDYNSLLVQFTGNDFRFSLFKNSIQCIFEHTFKNFYNLPIEKTDKMNKNTYINYYDVVSSDAYINFVPRNEYIYDKYNPYTTFPLNTTVKQIGDTNKLNIKLNSYSYFYNQKPIQYYLLS